MVGAVLGKATISVSQARTDRLSHRVLAALIMVPVALGLTWLGGWAFYLLIIGCAGLLAREWARLCGVSPMHLHGCALILGITILLFVAVLEQRHLAAAMVGVGLFMVMVMATIRQIGSRRAFWFALGVVAILPAGLSLVWMRALEPEGLGLICWVMAVVWVADSAAYAVGRTVGGPLLAPRISPSKTWSGLVGGLVGASLIGGWVAVMLGQGGFAMAAIAGLLVGAASGLGDLFESYFKRKFKVKDSGGLIPGHGGVLDRLDSLLAAAPATALLYLAGWRWL
jgi:phosphatidate cytidylyltransferase